MKRETTTNDDLRNQIRGMLHGKPGTITSKFTLAKIYNYISNRLFPVVL